MNGKTINFAVSVWARNQTSLFNYSFSNFPTFKKLGELEDLESTAKNSIGTWCQRFSESFKNVASPLSYRKVPITNWISLLQTFFGLIIKIIKFNYVLNLKAQRVQDVCWRENQRGWQFLDGKTSPRSFHAVDWITFSDVTRSGQ